MLPLAGLRVLDLTRVLAGPYATMILADMGADVIKVERPGVGDETRTWGPPFFGHESVYNLSVNRGKRSICVDMSQPAGSSLVRKLARKSDILVENFLPGRLGRFHLDYKSLSADNPGLVYCSITGYGQKGPWSYHAGYDVVAAAVGGLLHITGPEEGEPCRVGVAMTDLSTGLYAVSTILAALLRRGVTGRGDHIDVNLLATQVATLTHIGANWLMANQEARRWGTGHHSIVPYQAFRTADQEYLIIGAGNNSHFSKVCERLQREDLLHDSRYASNVLRVQNRKVLLKELSAEFVSKPLKHWMEVFEGSGIPYGPVNSLKQVFANPQVKYLGLAQRLQHNTLGEIHVPGPAWKLSSIKEHKPARAPPTLGEHTDEVLQHELNLTEQEIQSLRNNSVVQ